MLADKIEADKKKAEDELVQKAKEEEEKKKAEEEAARELEEEKKRKEREDRLKRREESRGDSFQGGDLDDLEAAASTAAAQTASEDSKTNEQTTNSKDSEKVCLALHFVYTYTIVNGYVCMTCYFSDFKVSLEDKTSKFDFPTCRTHRQW